MYIFTIFLNLFSITPKMNVKSFLVQYDLDCNLNMRSRETGPLLNQFRPSNQEHERKYLTGFFMQMQQYGIESVIEKKLHFSGASNEDGVENKGSVNQQEIISYIEFHYEMELWTTELRFCTEVEQIKLFSL